MEHAAGAVLDFRPVNLAALVVVGVVLGPLLCLLHGVDRLPVRVLQRNVGVDEAVPVSVQLGDSVHHGPVDLRVVAPARRCQNIQHRVAILVEQAHGVQAGVFAFLGFFPQNVGSVHHGGVHGVIGAGDSLGRGRLDELHHGGPLGEVIAQGVVHALGHVIDREGVQNDLRALDFRAVVLHGQRLGDRLSVPVNVGVEHIHDIDRAYVSFGVVEVLGENLAEREVLPVGLGVPGLGLYVAHAGEFDRHVNEPAVRVAPDEVHGRGADIGADHAPLPDFGYFGVADLAVCAV